MLIEVRQIAAERLDALAFAEWLDEQPQAELIALQTGGQKFLARTEEIVRRLEEVTDVRSERNVSQYRDPASARRLGHEKPIVHP
ncbi:MAG TPA: hypothetical protein VJ276_01415 [Thermoanaerobaculia bacterium]|nr:hypothetical protein [Thermoanaerobaculia bacterium]